jgi:uncharacterized protein (TIGR02996 family)
VAAVTHNDAFLQAIIDHPNDAAPRLLYADWLEEQDDLRRAELLRLHHCLLATCCDPDRHPERVAQQARLVELLSQGVRPAWPQRTVVLGQGVEMTFSWIPPGTFLMGSPTNEPEREGNGVADETQHKVTLTKGFWLGVHPVTQAQWQAVMGANPSYFKGDSCPVERISWDDAAAFCEALSTKDGKPYRLPTDAGWEYACRAGTTTPFHFGATISADQANYDGSYTYTNGKKGVSRQKTTPVGSYPANAWGLFDMHGNVWEWRADWYGPHETGDITDPQGVENGEARVLRGGSWYDGPWRCCSACRCRSAPGNRYPDFGCRVALCLD